MKENTIKTKLKVDGPSTQLQKSFAKKKRFNQEEIDGQTHEMQLSFRSPKKKSPKSQGKIQRLSLRKKEYKVKGDQQKFEEIIDVFQNKIQNLYDFSQIKDKMSQQFQKYAGLTKQWEQHENNTEFDSLFNKLISNFRSIIFSIFQKHILSTQRTLQKCNKFVASLNQAHLKSVAYYQQKLQTQFQEMIDWRDRMVFNCKLWSQFGTLGNNVESMVKSSDTYRMYVNFYGINLKEELQKQSVNASDDLSKQDSSLKCKSQSLQISE